MDEADISEDAARVKIMKMRNDKNKKAKEDKARGGGGGTIKVVDLVPFDEEPIIDAVMGETEEGKKRKDNKGLPLQLFDKLIGQWYNGKRCLFFLLLQFFLLIKGAKCGDEVKRKKKKKEDDEMKKEKEENKNDQDIEMLDNVDNIFDEMEKQVKVLVGNHLFSLFYVRIDRLKKKQWP